MKDFRSEQYDVIVVGAGLAGSVVARYMAEELKKRVAIIEKRNHIGGNVYDYKAESGILVHKYGPHTFHTNKKELYDYICKYAQWEEYKLECMAVINGKFTPAPFNFETIDSFYEQDKAKKIKEEIYKEYPNCSFATVLELLEHKNNYIREYAEFLFHNDYSLYTAKQWGITPNKIDSSVLKRVPIRFNYQRGYFEDKFQCMPKNSYEDFFISLQNHENIDVFLCVDAKDYMEIRGNQIFWNNQLYQGIVLYTGAIDELFNYEFGSLPYRSLHFKWVTEKKKNIQPAAVVAYPQEADFTRITEYNKLPMQLNFDVTTYAIEYPVSYRKGENLEPYYPIPTVETEKVYAQYRRRAEEINNLYLCGRLADYKYYNMDQTLENALNTCCKIKEKIKHV